MATHNGIYFKDSGESLPPLVLVHGYTCDHTDWDRLASDLRGKYRTIAVDLNGHGNSVQGTPTAEVMGSEVLGVMAYLGISEAVIAGHSMGTRIIVECALQANHAVAGLIMVDGSRGAWSAEHLEQIKALRSATDYPTYARHLFSQMFTDKTPASVQKRVIERATTMDRQWAMTLHNNIAEYDAFSLEPALAAIDVPMLVLQTNTRADDGGRALLNTGDSTPYTEFLAQHFSRRPSRIEIIPDTGHFPQFEEPAALAARVSRFVDEISGAAG